MSQALHNLQPQKIIFKERAKDFLEVELPSLFYRMGTVCLSDYVQCLSIVEAWFWLEPFELCSLIHNNSKGNEWDAVKTLMLLLPLAVLFYRSGLLNPCHMGQMEPCHLAHWTPHESINLALGKQWQF